MQQAGTEGILTKPFANIQEAESCLVDFHSLHWRLVVW